MTPEAAIETQWIPVDEMLPEYFEVVLIWQQIKYWETSSCVPRFQGQLSQGYLRPARGWVVRGPIGIEHVVNGTGPNVTHWMPLPPAPAGQKFWPLNKARM